jgi:hypothetical protein
MTFGRKTKECVKNISGKYKIGHGNDERHEKWTVQYKLEDKEVAFLNDLLIVVSS